MNTYNTLLIDEVYALLNTINKFNDHVKYSIEDQKKITESLESTVDSLNDVFQIVSDNIKNQK